MMRQRLMTCALAVLLAGSVARAETQQLQFPDLSKLGVGAEDVVDLSIDEALLGLASAFLGDGQRDGTDEAKLKSLLSAVRGIYVRSFKYARDGAYDPAVLDGIHRQLSTGSWSRMLASRSAAERRETQIYMWRNGSRPGGMALVSSGPREVTIVNIVGSIDLAQLRALSGRFGIPAVPD